MLIGILLKCQVRHLNVKHFILTNNYLVAPSVCTTFHGHTHIYFYNIALHPYATKPIPQHLQAQEDASPHCS